jgi:hypothetical protein
MVNYTLHSSNMHRNIDVMDRDMHLAFAKAFAFEGGRFRHLRRRAYANLNLVLSGSYFGAGRSTKAVWSGLRSCLFRPQTVLRLARAPARRLARRLFAS